jgi:hypothetical protein
MLWRASTPAVTVMPEPRLVYLSGDGALCRQYENSGQRHAQPAQEPSTVSGGGDEALIFSGLQSDRRFGRGKTLMSFELRLFAAQLLGTLSRSTCGISIINLSSEVAATDVAEMYRSLVLAEKRHPFRELLVSANSPKGLSP